MIILALDSTATVSSVAVCDGAELLCEYTLNNGNTHSETLLPMIENALASLKMDVDDVDVFACSAGPGSFTGVRIGAATIKGLAFAKDKKCVGISTLDALAENLRGVSGIICPVMNARRSQLYNALFSSDGNTLVRLCPDRAVSVDELRAELCEKYQGEPIYFCGDGYSIAFDAIKCENVANTPKLLRNQSAYSVALVALEAIENATDEEFSDSDLRATYLRPSQAERERLEREAKTEQ